MRSPLFPDIPTLKEATGEDYPPPWFGLFAPAGTPKPILEKINAEVRRIAADPAFMTTQEELEAVLDPNNFSGRSAEQVETFIGSVVDPLLKQYETSMSGAVVLNV